MERYLHSPLYDFKACTWTNLSSSLSFITPLTSSFPNLHLQFYSYKSTCTSLFFLAFRMPLRCPWVDHISNIWLIIVNFLILLSSVFWPFCLSSSAVIHFGLGFLLKKKNIFLRQYKHSYYCCCIYCFSFRCPTGSAYGFTFAASWVLLWSVCLSVRQSIGIYRSKCLPQSQSALPTLHLDSDFLVFSGIKGMRVSCLQLSPLKREVKSFVKLF